MFRGVCILVVDLRVCLLRPSRSKRTVDFETKLCGSSFPTSSELLFMCVDPTHSTGVSSAARPARPTAKSCRRAPASAAAASEAAAVEVLLHRS
jgi:hypothetical protein